MILACMAIMELIEYFIDSICVSTEASATDKLLNFSGETERQVDLETLATAGVLEF